jgi:hypothetical protein
MTAVSPPFSTPEAVAYLMSIPLKTGTNFTTTTNPTLAAVTQFISWISSQMELQFSMAGYILPLAEIADETWPTSQTTYLQLVATLGTVAMAGGFAQKPLPAIAPGRSSSSGNVFQDLYNAELAKIYDSANNKTWLNFRSQYRIGTPAQIALTDPRGPTTDFLEGYYDPYRHYDNYAIANKVLAIQLSLEDLDISWDYMYGILSRGLGTSIYESIQTNFSERLL